MKRDSISSGVHSTTDCCMAVIVCSTNWNFTSLPSKRSRTNIGAGNLTRGQNAEKLHVRERLPRRLELSPITNYLLKLLFHFHA